ncbi:hypothetical protein ACFHWV_25680, partial [Micromonospora sp. LOL_028]|uniref:hypothetical protein n=1 Tax=Micromonospora sp. LOL_028 TaxID=3345420 RepID=UPI003A8BDAA1
PSSPNGQRHDTPTSEPARRPSYAWTARPSAAPSTTTGTSCTCCPLSPETRDRERWAVCPIYQGTVAGSSVIWYVDIMDSLAEYGATIAPS